MSVLKFIGNVIKSIPDCAGDMIWIFRNVRKARRAIQSIVGGNTECPVCKKEMSYQGRNAALEQIPIASTSHPIPKVIEAIGVEYLVYKCDNHKCKYRESISILNKTIRC